MNIQLAVENLQIDYGRTRAVNNVSFQLEKGQIGCFLGPSGCGKTSLLRAIAGFENPNSGTIQLAGNTVSDNHKSIPPEKRRVGMVFQDFALFPHLTVEKNIGFGLHHLKQAEREDRVKELLAMVSLSPYAKSFPHELSGGQQQRVALARAIAPQPDILLLDEPFSSLDAELREHIAEEVRALLKKHNITAILVTHDQHEAFAMADTIGVMQAGNLLQWDKPYTLYHNPGNRFIANFIGDGSVLSAKVNDKGELENGLGIISGKDAWDKNCEYEILVRPDDVIYQADSEVALEITGKRFRGADYFYELQTPDQQTILCTTPSHIDLAIGSHLPVALDLQHLVIFSKHCNI